MTLRLAYVIAYFSFLRYLIVPLNTELGLLEMKQMLLRSHQNEWPADPHKSAPKTSFRTRQPWRGYCLSVYTGLRPQTTNLLGISICCPSQTKTEIKSSHVPIHMNLRVLHFFPNISQEDIHFRLCLAQNTSKHCHIKALEA